jgi:hypothetical protein
LQFTVRLRGIIVGRAELATPDPATGARSGAFRPGPGYNLVQPLFQLSGQRFEQAMQALKLELLDDKGDIVPTRSIDIRNGELRVFS